MQKLDFVRKLEEIVQQLKSKEIKYYFDQAMLNPDKPYKFSQVTNLLFPSKSNFDQLMQDTDVKQILEGFNALVIYSDSNLSLLTTHLNNRSIVQFLTQKQCLQFYNFHATIMSTLTISKKLLVSNSLMQKNEETLENGIIIFQIAIEEDGLQIEKYTKIFSLLNELIQVIHKIYSNKKDSGTESVEVILLDSGSDTNIGLKTSVETAKSLFLIFKEVWDYFTNRKFYKQKQETEALMESLTIRENILEMKNKGVIEEDEATEYIHTIKTRTNDLISLKVLPKTIVQESHQVNNRNILEMYEGFKLLEQKKEE